MTQSRCAQGSSDDIPLRRLAERQHGVVSWGQLLALGYTKRSIATLVARGWLIRVHRAVYAVGHARLTLRGRWMAAVLACGEGTVLSHGDAAALHNLARAPAGDSHVTSPGRHTIPGICCHSGQTAGAVVIDAIPVTSLARTLLDRAASLSRQRIRTLLETALHQQSLDVEELRALIAASAGRRTALCEVLDVLSDHAPWPVRARAHDARATGRPVSEPRVNVMVDGDLVDFFWPDHDLIVERRRHGRHRGFADGHRAAALAADDGPPQNAMSSRATATGSS